MPASAAFHVNANASLVKTAVSASTSFTCTLDSSIGVDSCVFSIATTDDQSAVADWVAGATTPTSQVFTAPAVSAKACRVKCVVNGGSYVDEHGVVVTGGELIKYAKVYIAPEVLVYGETAESNALTGWVGQVNGAIRVASGLGNAVTIVGDNGNTTAFGALLTRLASAGVIVDKTSNVLGSVGIKGWLTSTSGIGVADAAAVPRWLDRVSSLVTTEATNRPLFRAAPAVLNGYPAVDFDGTNHKLVSSDVATSWFGPVGDFSIVAAVHADAVVGTAGTFADEAIVSEGNTRISMLLFLNGANYTLRGCVYDGAFKYASAVIGTSLPAKGFIAEMRLVGGNLTMSVNGTDGTPVACGPADVYGSFVRIGSNAGGTAFFNGQIAEVATFGVGTKQTALIDAFFEKYIR